MAWRSAPDRVRWIGGRGGPESETRRVYPSGGEHSAAIGQKSAGTASPILPVVRSVRMLITLLLAAATPTFDPMRFFNGQTRGDGQLKVVLRAHVPISVRGSGRMEGETLVLDQAVTEGTKPPRTRQWRLRRTSTDRYAGTLTDARGPVTGEVDGNRLHLSFTTDKGIKVQQWLTLAANGRSADNRLEARKFGLKVATLVERITRID